MATLDQVWTYRHINDHLMILLCSYSYLFQTLEHGECTSNVQQRTHHQAPRDRPRDVHIHAIKKPYPAQHPHPISPPPTHTLAMHSEPRFHYNVAVAWIRPILSVQDIPRHQQSFEGFKAPSYTWQGDEIWYTGGCWIMKDRTNFFIILSKCWMITGRTGKYLNPNWTINGVMIGKC